VVSKSHQDGGASGKADSYAWPVVVDVGVFEALLEGSQGSRKVAGTSL
jgi:hypothetical protein